MLSLNTLTVAVISLAGLVSAVPLVQPRSCIIKYPSFLSYIQDFTPDTSYPGQEFEVFHDGPQHIENRVALVRWDNFPAGATGCTLRVAVPANQVYAIGQSQLDIWSVSTSTPVSAANTWNNQPTKDTLLGTYQFPKTPDPAFETTNIASFSCASSLSFYFQMSTWQTNEGSIFLQNTLSGAPGDTGFSIVYNC